MGEQKIGGLLLQRSPFLSNHNNIAAAVKKKTSFSSTGTLIKAAVAVSNSQTRDRIKLKQLFQDANKRCRTSPYEGLSFTLDDFLTAIEQFPTRVKGSGDAKPMVDTHHPHLGIGSLVTGTVQSLKPYGAFIHIGGGINGLLHVTQISHHRVSDIPTLLQPGDTLKVIILSYDRQTGRLSLSTKKLEPTPGDMIRNPNLVFHKAEEMAQTFSQRIAQAEALARANIS